MTPKEKAKELVEKFYYYLPNNSINNKLEEAKGCVLITINEVKKSMEQEIPHPGFQIYWNKVKEEIEKL